MNTWDLDLRDFLMSRRAAIDPASAGLPPSPTPRRGRGLRREDVAALAGVSVDYYARLEQGRIGNVSDQVLTAIENALRLDALEREYLRALVLPGIAKMRRGRPSQAHARVALRTLIDAMDPIPALLHGRRMEVLASNRAARVLLTDFDARPVSERNLVRWLFLEPLARTRYPQWADVAASAVAALRANRNPRFPDDALESLVAEMSRTSREFARLWAEHHLFQHGHGRIRIFHDPVGELTLNYESLEIPGTDGQFLSTYTADVGSPAAEKLRLLMSWNAPAPGSAHVSPRFEDIGAHHATDEAA